MERTAQAAEKRRTERSAIFSTVIMSAMLLLTACSADENRTDTAVTLPPETDTSLTAAAEAPVYDYVHGEEGYFNLLENGVEFELIRQLSGTCWVCASICSMDTGYQMDHDGSISLDQMELLDRIYNDDKNEGIFISEGIDKGNYGGIGLYVVNELSLGFGDGLVIDGAISAKGWSPEEIKAGIRKYGALYIGIPDTDRSKMKYYGDYFTMNFPDAGEYDFDHSIAVIGWDDNFPKEYFRNEASQDGAWITCNSSFAKDYYYVSYDTPFDQKYDPPLFMSVTDKYSKVLSHDGGLWCDEPVITGKTTTTANVFKGEGTLAAVGTYSLADDQDITVQILTPDLTECLYSQECHIDKTGYHVIELEQPQKVDKYAVSVSYTKGAPVEGESMELDSALSVRTVSGSGQSFILIGDEWLDMSQRSTWDKCGFETNNVCIRALYTE